MTDELLENFTKQLIEAHQIPTVTFTWQGGEPTLRGLDFFRKAMELQKKYSGDKKIENAFQTNGTRLNDDWCKFFVDNNILVGISIDGAEHNHDHYRRTFSGGTTFKKVMKGIELLHKHKIEFNTLSTVNDYNVRYACHGECPKHRFLHTPDGKPGLNYLCEGYKLFFKHVEPYMEFMAKELKNKRPPANIMSWIKNKENQAIKPVMPGREELLLYGHCDPAKREKQSPSPAEYYG